MSEPGGSQWSCQTCSQSSSTYGDLCIHCQECKDRRLYTSLARATDSFADLQKVILHTKHQPVSQPSESSDASEDENDQSGSLPVRTGLAGPFNNSANLRCPHTGCSNKTEVIYGSKSNLNRHYATHIPITEKCPFCGRPFARLRPLLHHVRRCKVKEGLKKEGKCLEAKQYLATERIEILRKGMNQQLNQQLSIVGNIKERESSGGGDTGNRRNEPGTGFSRKGTPEPAISKSHNGGEVSADKESIPAREGRRIQKRRRSGTIVSSGPLLIAQSKQSRQVHEEGDMGTAASALSSLNTTYVLGTQPGGNSTLGPGDPGSVENPLSTETPLRDQGLAIESLTGDVYDLEIEDLQSMLLSWPDDIRGQIRLTDPFVQVHSPFITIPISGALSKHFASQRRKTM